MPTSVPEEQAPAVILVKAYDYVLWSVQKAEKFPRSFRFSVGERIVQGSLDLLLTLVEASYSRDKAPLLTRANRELTSPRNPFEAALQKAREAFGRFAYVLKCDVRKYFRLDRQPHPEVAPGAGREVRPDARPRGEGDRRLEPQQERPHEPQRQQRFPVCSGGGAGAITVAPGEPTSASGSSSGRGASIAAPNSVPAPGPW